MTSNEYIGTVNKLSVRNNPSLTLTKVNPALEYINKGQPSSLELAFGVELGLSQYTL